MVSPVDLHSIADRLIDAHASATTLARITAGTPGFDSAAAYAVLDRIAALRTGQGWRLAGRKVGFTNRTIWARYGVDKPMWAHIWDRTVTTAASNRASLSLRSFVQPRIEPEVVFGLDGPLPVTDDPLDLLSAVAWMAPGFEIVQCHFPDWKFEIADCTAAFGLHGALVVGSQVRIDHGNRAAVAARLPVFEVELSRNGSVVDRGVGANVLDSPALALGHLARLLTEHPQSTPLSAGEIVTTGTVTDAWSIAPGETWVADYGTLGLESLTVTFT